MWCSSHHSRRTNPGRSPSCLTPWCCRHRPPLFLSPVTSVRKLKALLLTLRRSDPEAAWSCRCGGGAHESRSHGQRAREAREPRLLSCRSHTRHRHERIPSLAMGSKSNFGTAAGTLKSVCFRKGVRKVLVAFLFGFSVTASLRQCC